MYRARQWWAGTEQDPENNGGGGGGRGGGGRGRVVAEFKQRSVIFSDGDVLVRQRQQK